MKTTAVLFLLAAVVVGCGGGSANESGVDTETITWKKGPAPGTGSDVWTDLPAGTDINALCDDFYGNWPDAIEEETDVTLQAGKERLICVKVE